MFCFLLPSIILSVTMPKYSMVFVSEYYDDESIKEMEDSMKQMVDELRKICDYYDGADKKACKESLEVIQGFHYANPKTLDSTLAKVSKKTEYLYFLGLFMGDTVVDFNILKSSMEVFFLAIDDYSMKKHDDIKKYTQGMITKVFKQINKVKFDGSLNSIARLSQKFSKKIVKEDYGTARIVGNIGSKVHFITFVSQTVKFEKSPCNCETVFLSDSNLHSESEQINSKYLLVDTSSHSNIKRKSELIKVNQYSLYLINLYTSYNYQVSYDTSKWVVKRSTYKNFDSSDYSIDVSYEIADSFSILVYSFYININVDDTGLSVCKDVNVTVMDWEISTENPFGAKKLEKDEIEITTSGDWSKITKKPSLVLTADSSKFSVNDENSDIKPQVREAYTFKPKKNGPNVALIVGIVVAVVVVIAIVVVVVVIVLRKKKQSKEKSSEQENDKV